MFQMMEATLNANPVHSFEHGDGYYQTLLVDVFGPELFFGRHLMQLALTLHRTLVAVGRACVICERGIRRLTWLRRREHSRTRDVMEHTYRESVVI